MFDTETWSVIERHLQRFPAGEFRDLLASGDYDVRWPLTFAAWYNEASSASVDQACLDFLTSANLWGEALKVFPEYSDRQDLSSWLSLFIALNGEVHDD